MATRPDEQRAADARRLAAVVVKGQTSDQVLSRFPADPLVRDMFYGALRHHVTLARNVDGALAKPLRAKDQDIYCLLIVGAYQLQFSHVPAHAAINETVAACKVLRKPWSSRLVNGVLRSLQRQTSVSEHSASDRVDGPFSEQFPEWISTRIQRDYPLNAEAILAANLSRAPMSLRVNQCRSTPEHYRELLDAQNIEYAAGFRDEYLVLSSPIPTQALPGFDGGLVSIQDAGAGFIADLVTTEKGPRLLDACAAPGGKLFHLMECLPDLEAVAVEMSPTRMERLRTQATRLGHTPTTLIGDATRLDWWDGAEFDTVLVDAPCSGSGTLRRHPDIAILRSASDLVGYARLQGQLLTNLWHTLRPGGNLLYCTCSLFTEENDAVIAGFIEATNDAEVDGISFSSGVAREFGWQLLPTESKTDGFYFSALTKTLDKKRK